MQIAHTVPHCRCTARRNQRGAAAARTLCAMALLPATLTAGPTSSESRAVLYNIPGHKKPFVQPVTQAEKTMQQADLERKR